MTQRGEEESFLSVCRYGVVYSAVACVQGFTALHDPVEILVTEGGVREKETDRWERVN